MNRNSGLAVFFAVSALVLCVASWMFGLNLMPTRAAALEDGTLVPWTITWGMIWITTVSGLSLAAFLLASLRRGSE